jgi:hypothetical protein
MGQSSLLGAERATREPKGRDTEALGPSDSSDSGSDMAGLQDAEIADPALPVDVALRDDSPHSLLGSENLAGRASDVGGTGERRSAGSDAGAAEAHDVGIDQVFVAGPAGQEEDPPDDEDPDLAFVDDLLAQDLEPADEFAEGQEDDEGEHSALRAGTLPVPPQPNPAPDEPEAPERPEQPPDDTDAAGRSIPALLRRPR